MTNKPQVRAGSIYSSIYENDPAKAAEMEAKANLVREIATVRANRKLTQMELGALIGLSQPDVSRMLNGDFEELSLTRILGFLTALDRDVEIRVSAHPVQGEHGRMSVAVA